MTALAIARKLDTFGISPDIARDLPASARMDVAVAAGVRLTSQETWDAAVDLLAEGVGR